MAWHFRLISTNGRQFSAPGASPDTRCDLLAKGKRTLKMEIESNPDKPGCFLLHVYIEREVRTLSEGAVGKDGEFIAMPIDPPQSKMTFDVGRGFTFESFKP